MTDIHLALNDSVWGHSITSDGSYQIANVVFRPQTPRDGRKKERDLEVLVNVQHQRIGDVINNDRNTRALYEWIEGRTAEFAQALAVKIAQLSEGNLILQADEEAQQ